MCHLQDFFQQVADLLGFCGPPAAVGLRQRVRHLKRVLRVSAQMVQALLPPLYPSCQGKDLHGEQSRP